MKFHFNKVIKIGRKNIGENKPSFIVAEISANHSQNLEKAKKLLILAKKSGADAVKIQTYKPESISIKGIKDLKKNKTWKKI